MRVFVSVRNHRLPFIRSILVYVIASLLILAQVNCGGGSSTGPSSTGSDGEESKREVLYLEASTGSEAQIRSFNIDPSTGALSPLSSFTTSNWGPYWLTAMKVDPSAKFLYTSDFGSGDVRVYSINPSSAALSEINGSPFVSPQTSGNGSSMAITPNGKFLFVGDTFGRIGAFSISSGTLIATGAGALDENNPWDFAVDPASKFLLAANNSDPSGGQFSVFSIDSATGNLAGVPGSPFTFQTNSGPRSITVHPNGKFAYALTGYGASGLNVNTTTGVLTEIQGSPWATNDIPQTLVLHPTGKFLYVSQYGTGTLLAFTVDSTTGALTRVPGSPYYAPVLESLAIDPSGKYLYGSSSGSLVVAAQLAAYQIDQSTGALTVVPGLPFAAGNRAGKLVVVQFP